MIVLFEFVHDIILQKYSIQKNMQTNYKYNLTVLDDHSVLMFLQLFVKLCDTDVQCILNWKLENSSYIPDEWNMKYPWHKKDIIYEMKAIHVTVC